MIADELFCLGDRFYGLIGKAIDEYVFAPVRQHLRIVWSDRVEESTALCAASQPVRRVFDEES